MCDMTHPYVRHDSSICATRLIHMCDTTHPYVQHDSSCARRDLFSHATRLIHMWDMTPCRLFPLFDMRLWKDTVHSIMSQKCTECPCIGAHGVISHTWMSYVTQSKLCIVSCGISSMYRVMSQKQRHTEFQMCLWMSHVACPTQSHVAHVDEIESA